MKKTPEQLTNELCLCDGHEAIEYAAEYLKDISDSVEKTPLGITARLNGKNDYTVMLEAHIDEIGLIVTAVDEKGFLRIARLGGVDRRVSEDAAVTVCASDGKKYRGIICTTPPHLLKNDDKKAIEFENMAVDTGFSAEKAKKLFSPGDRVYFFSPPCMLGEETITSKALDDRCGCAAVINAFERLSENRPEASVLIMLSDLEEINAAGAATGAFREQPDEALVVDVSFGAYPGVEKNKTGQPGKGAMIGVSPILNREITKKLNECAQNHSLEFQSEIMGGSTGTDSDKIAVSACGVKCGLLSIPLKNMHTPVETVRISDIQNVADILYNYVSEGGCRE